jgi:CBS domain-containing protein
LAQPVPLLPLTAAPAEVIARLAADGGSAALLTAPDGGVVGIVTAGDLARRGGATAYQAMSAPVRALPSNASLAEALAAMTGAQVGRLVVAGEDGRPRLLTAARLLEALHQGPGHLAAEAAIADQAALLGVGRRLGAWMAALARTRLDPELTAAEGARIADAVLLRCIALTEAEMGAPPAPCALLLAGSQGRREMLPGADQDNALVFADGADPRWFQAFASQVAARFHAAGWPRCQHGYHAGNERWCMPLAGWRQRCDGWIRCAEPQAVLEASVLLDWRPLWGDAALAGELDAAVRAGIAAKPVFLLQMARALLEARPPLGMFGSIRADDQRMGTIDLKLAMLHMTGFARIKALTHGVAGHGTGMRLRRLAEGGHLAGDLAAEVLSGWRFLLGLRTQTRSVAGGGDHVDPSALGAWDLALLKRALASIDTLRDHLRQELARAGV